MEIDVETVGVPVTLTPDVSLNSASSAEELNLTSTLPSSVFITAEVVEGDALGNITELEVSIPSELDTLLNSDSGVILEENLEVDLITENSNGTRSGGGGGAQESSLDDLSNSEWASNISSTSDRRQHSVDFTTQPTSKFVTLDSTNTLPLAVSGLQLSTSNVTGDEIPSSSSSLPSSFSTSSSSSSSVPSSSLTSTSSSTSLSTSSATSLSNSLLCASSSVISDKVGSECLNSDCSGSQVLTSSHLQESLSADALSVTSGLLLSNNKNNGSNVLSSAATNNLVSQKLLASTTRTNDSLANSESNNSAAVLTNGPSNSLDSSKCAKVDHYMFHET